VKGLEPSPPLPAADESQGHYSLDGLFLNTGPTLPRPRADVISTSRHANMQELRGKVEDRHLRVLYALDHRRAALLLLGGDKTGDPKWYNKSVPLPTICSINL
jgi:hypothetical protein